MVLARGAQSNKVLFLCCAFSAFPAGAPRALQALADAGLEASQVANVEVVGGSTRVPAVLRLLTEFFGKEPSRTLNAKETVSRGCALQCAMLSPTFRVRDFQVLDSFPYGVQFRWVRRGRCLAACRSGPAGGVARAGACPGHNCVSAFTPQPAPCTHSAWLELTTDSVSPLPHRCRSWEKDGQEVTSTVFERGSLVPSAKMLTFYRAEPFSIRAEYTPDSDIPATADRAIGGRRFSRHGVFNRAKL